MTRKESEERRGNLTKEIRKAMEKRKAAADSGDRVGDLEAQGEIGDLMAQVDEARPQISSAGIASREVSSRRRPALPDSMEAGV